MLIANVYMRSSRTGSLSGLQRLRLRREPGATPGNLGRADRVPRGGGERTFSSVRLFSIPLTDSVIIVFRFWNRFGGGVSRVFSIHCF